MNDRLSIIDSLSSLNNFVSFISTKYPDLLDVINNSDISLDEYGNRINLSYIQTELSKLQIINPLN